MKRFLNYYLSMTLIASLFVVTSCGEEEDPIIDAPTVSFDGVVGNEATLEVGEPIDFNVNVTAPAGFNSFSVTRTVNGVTTEIFSEEGNSTTPATAYEYTFGFVPGVEHSGQEVIFDFIAMDNSTPAREGKATFTVNVEEANVVAYNTVLLDAPLEDQSSNVWFSTSTGQRYSTQAVNATTENISGQIDFGYRYGPTAKATLASPADYPSEGGQTMTGWTLNNTMLKVANVTPSQFLEMGENAAFIVDAYENGTQGANGRDERITGLTAGQVLAFKTDPDKAGGSKYGLIHIAQIVEGTGTEGEITLNVRVIE